MKPATNKIINDIQKNKYPILVLSFVNNNKSEMVRGDAGSILSVYEALKINKDFTSFKVGIHNPDSLLSFKLTLTIPELRAIAQAVESGVDNELAKEIRNTAKILLD